MRPFDVLVLLLVATAPVACYDPVHHDAVANLGDDDLGVAPGPMHRPGQPCTTCHGGEGPADSEFSIAGTLYEVRGGTAPVASGIVTVTDALGTSRSVTSNEAGNFFVRKSEWEPVFRLRVVVEARAVRKEMLTSIARDGGCASCHRGAGDATYMPGVYLREK